MYTKYKWWDNKNDYKLYLLEVDKYNFNEIISKIYHFNVKLSKSLKSLMKYEKGYSCIGNYKYLGFFTSVGEYCKVGIIDKFIIEDDSDWCYYHICKDFNDLLSLYESYKMGLI